MGRLEAGEDVGSADGIGADELGVLDVDVAEGPDAGEALGVLVALAEKAAQRVVEVGVRHVETVGSHANGVGKEIVFETGAIEAECLKGHSGQKLGALIAGCQQLVDVDVLWGEHQIAGGVRLGIVDVEALVPKALRELKQGRFGIGLCRRGSSGRSPVDGRDAFAAVSAARREGYDEHDQYEAVAHAARVRRPSHYPLGSIAPMPVDIDIAKVARLARLQLTAEELEGYGVQLEVILEHAGRVQSLDTEGVAPTSHPLPSTNAFRADEVTASLDHADVMGQAPEAIDGYFAVPAILEGDS